VSTVPPRRRRLIAATAAALALGLGALAARPLLARAVRARIEAEAARHGLVARIDSVRVGLWPPLRLTGVALEDKERWRLNADTVEAWWPGRTRLIVSRAVLQGPGGLTVAAPSTTWDVVGSDRDVLRVALRQPQAGLTLSRMLTLGAGSKEPARTIRPATPNSGFGGAGRAGAGVSTIFWAGGFWMLAAGGRDFFSGPIMARK